MKKIVLILITLFMFINVQAIELDLNSKYVYAYNLTENREMYDLNANKEVKVASMTKIMTAIIVIENNKNLDEYITIKDEDLRDMYEYTTTGFQAGNKVTKRELLYGILLKSGSDAVNAAVRTTTDTEEEFINLMNQKVKELGLVHTHFSNAVGKDKNNYSSSYDIAHIMKYCLKNETFKEIISTDTYYIDRLKLQINGPLYKMDSKYGIDLSMIKGSKSGYTDLAMFSLVSYGEKNGIEYIVVAICADNFRNLLYDNEKVYNYFFDNYEYIDYNVDFNLYIENAKDEQAYNIDFNTLLYLPKNYDKDLLVYKYDGVDKITFLNKKGSKLGKVDILYDGELIETKEIKLNKTILYNPKAFIWPIFLILIINFVIFVFIIKILINKKRKKKRIKEKRKTQENLFINEEIIKEKKLHTLNNTTNIDLFFNTIEGFDNVNKISLEHDLIDRCFQDINFKDIEDLKDLYTKFKLYKEKMCKETIKYYNTLFKYCIEKYVDNE